MYKIYNTLEAGGSLVGIAPEVYYNPCRNGKLGVAELAPARLFSEFLCLFL